MLTSLLSYLLSYGRKEWLVCFALPPTMLLISMPVITIVILRYTALWHLTHRSGMLIVILVISTLALSVAPPYAPLTDTTFKKLTITRRDDGTLDIIDDGHFNRKGSPAKYVQFELRPYLIKHYGTTNIHTFTILRPSKRSYEAALALADTFVIASLIINETKRMPPDTQLASKIDGKIIIERNVTAAS